MSTQLTTMEGGGEGGKLLLIVFAIVPKCAYQQCLNMSKIMSVIMLDIF